LVRPDRSEQLNLKVTPSDKGRLHARKRKGVEALKPEFVDVPGRARLNTFDNDADVMDA
jgi:predicted RNA-binding protein YlqC (UPF0109 family)